MKRFTCLSLVSLLLLLPLVSIVSCGQTSTPTTPTPSGENLTQAPGENVTPTLPTTEADTMPPSSIGGLVANNAYDGRVNLWWDKSGAEDFDHYNVHVSKSQILDVTGMKPIQQIKDIAICRYQVTGLEDGTKYYFAVTAVDKSGNEGKRVASLSATPAPMPRGTVDPDISVDVYQSELAWAGTTLLPLNHNPQRPRIVEVNMLGEVVWEYVVPQQGILIEAELLPNNNILYTVSSKGVYEIDRSGKVVWQYLTSKIDHDADRLPNGNTIFVFGMSDQKSDAQVTEVNPKGEIVWQWYARDYFDRPPYNSIYEEGSWTHTNAVTRLTNGNTLISLRNFNCVVEVDPQGAIVRTIGEGVLVEVHDPEILPNGDILGALPIVTDPIHAIEIDPNSGAVVWQFRWPRELMPQSTRDANRLPNGNTLIVGLTKMVEVTSKGEIVWQLGLNVTLKAGTERSSGFYKADRISAQK